MFSNYHRIIDARMRERRVLTAGECFLDAEGTVIAVHGFMVDLTGTVRKETERISKDAVEASNVHRGTIELAKGILMGFFRVDAESAFQMLVSVSNDSHLKLAYVAAEIAGKAPTIGVEEAIDGLLPRKRHPAD